MPTWEGIIDTDAEAPLTWLSRVKNKETDPWIPLRKSDCAALNEVHCNSDFIKTEVYIDGGRAIADLSDMTIKYHLYNKPGRELIYGSWFIVVKGGNPKSLIPLIENDAVKVELMYQKALKALSTIGDGGQSVLKEEILLYDNERKFKAVLLSSGEITSIRRRPVSWLGALSFTENFLIQRGYGAYTVEGELEEMSLGPLKHVVFIVHGIGEAMWSRPDMSSSSLVSEMDHLRSVVYKRLYDSWKKSCRKAIKNNEIEPLPPNRIEFLPICWFSKLHGNSSHVKKTVSSVTLKNIPLMRSLANDVVFDVMMYLTPEFCEEILEFVTEHINDDLKKIMDVHPDFDPLSKEVNNGCRCSIIGHSLGSVIVWDILSILKADMDNMENIEEASHNQSQAWGPSLSTSLKQKLLFTPGSPIGLFLSLRGAYDSLSKFANTSEITDDLISSFTLPVSNSLYNIFHPTDPVAYRIEPLLLPPDYTPGMIPSPCFLSTQEGGITFHTRLAQFGEGIQRTFSYVEIKLSETVSTTDDDKNNDKNRNLRRKTSDLKFSLGGSKSKYKRVDYQLQQGLIGNDYFSSLVAHTSYFRNEDIINFIIELANTGAGHDISTTVDETKQPELAADVIKQLAFFDAEPQDQDPI